MIHGGPGYLDSFMAARLLSVVVLYEDQKKSIRFQAWHTWELSCNSCDDSPASVRQGNFSMSKTTLWTSISLPQTPSELSGGPEISTLDPRAMEPLNP